MTGVHFWRRRISVQSTCGGVRWSKLWFNCFRRFLLSSPGFYRTQACLWELKVRFKLFSFAWPRQKIDESGHHKFVDNICSVLR